MAANDLGFAVDASGFLRSLDRFVETTRKDQEKALKDNLRNFVATAVRITPPHRNDSDIGSGSRGVGSSAAKKRGEAIVAAQARAAYVALPAVYDDIARDSEAKAHSFWWAIRRGNHALAQQILNASNSRYRGLPLKAFDGGTAHRKARAAGGRVPKGHRADTIIIDKKWMDGYVRKKQMLVGLLAAGWRVALQRLGGSAAAWINRHGAGGRIRIVDAGDYLEIEIVHSAPWVRGEVADLRRRVMWALDHQARAMERQIRAIQEKRARAASHGLLSAV